MKESDKLWYFSHLIYMFSVTPDGATMYHGPCSQERLQLTMCLSGLNDQQPTQRPNKHTHIHNFSSSYLLLSCLGRDILLHAVFFFSAVSVPLNESLYTCLVAYMYSIVLFFSGHRRLGSIRVADTAPLVGVRLPRSNGWHEHT